MKSTFDDYVARLALKQWCPVCLEQRHHTHSADHCDTPWVNWGDLTDEQQRQIIYAEED